MTDVFSPSFDALFSGSVPARLLLAVSGGPDSMALLDTAARWAAGKKTALAVGHVNHLLRGRASNADAAFVRKESEKRGLSFYVVRTPVRAFAEKEGLGIEEAARTLRYRALAALARRLRCAAVLTGHTLDDQAETMLMNLIRGTGPTGLGGMSPEAPWPVPLADDTRPSLRLLRPFLTLRRARIEDHLLRAGVPSRFDATNAEPAFQRNRIRPLLKRWEKERPGLMERWGRLADLLREEEDYWTATLAPLARRKEIDLAPFKRYHKAFQRRLIRQAFPLPSFAVVERARQFALAPGPTCRQSVPGGWIEKRRGRLAFRPLPSNKKMKTRTP